MVEDFGDTVFEFVRAERRFFRPPRVRRLRKQHSPFQFELDGRPFRRRSDRRQAAAQIREQHAEVATRCGPGRIQERRMEARRRPLRIDRAAARGEFEQVKDVRKMRDVGMGRKDALKNQRELFDHGERATIIELDGVATLRPAQAAEASA